MGNGPSTDESADLVAWPADVNLTAQTPSEPLAGLDLRNEINGGLGYMLNTAKEYNGR